MLHGTEDEERGVLGRGLSYASPSGGGGSSVGGTPQGERTTPVVQAQGLPGAATANPYPFPSHLHTHRPSIPPPVMPLHYSHAHAPPPPPPSLPSALAYHTAPSGHPAGHGMGSLYDLANAAAGQHDILPLRHTHHLGAAQSDNPYGAYPSLNAQLGAHGIGPPARHQYGAQDQGQAQRQEQGPLGAGEVPFFLEDSFAQELASFIDGTAGVGGCL